MIKVSASLLVFVLCITIIGCVQKTKERKKKFALQSTKYHLKTEGPAPEGKALFIQYCSACHGNDGKKDLNGVKDLTVNNKGINKIIKRITTGKENMPAFKTILTERQVLEIAKYVVQIRDE